MVRGLTLVIVLSFTSLAAVAEPVDYQEIKDLDKMSLALTGEPLDRDSISLYLEGHMTKDDIFDSLSKGDRFVNHIAKFWSNIIGIQSVQGINEILQEGTDTSLDNIIAQRTLTGLNKGSNAIDIMRRVADQKFNLTGSIRTHFSTCIVEGQREIWVSAQFLNGQGVKDVDSVLATNKYENGVPVVLAKASEFPGQSGQALANARLAESRRVHQHLRNVHNKMTVGSCENSRKHTAAVKPFWDKTGKIKYRAAKWLLAGNRCGSDLSKCHSIQRGRYPPLDSAREDSTLGAGRIIGKTIADDLEFKTILTTSKTVMSGNLANFLVNKLTDKIWEENFPGGKFPEKKTQYRGAKTNSDDLFWVERGSGHAGVLTSFAFQMVTNGRRAKANRAYEAFACSKFTVPQGAVPDPSDSNPDLRKRKYCAYCHRTLEPMAAFFNRWPETGRVNYEFDHGPDVDDQGVFRGKEGTGVQDYGKLLSESQSFDQCAIRRTFDFIHGRKLTETEGRILIPKYVGLLKESKGNLREVIRAMVNAREFTFESDEVQP